MHSFTHDTHSGCATGRLDVIEGEEKLERVTNQLNEEKSDMDYACRRLRKHRCIPFRTTQINIRQMAINFIAFQSGSTLTIIRPPVRVVREVLFCP